MHDTASLTIREVAAAEIVALRHAVLRPGRPIAEARYPADAADTSFHLGAFAGPELIGCATALFEPVADDPTPAYRLRGMAVTSERRNQGIGGELLAAFDAGVRARGVNHAWCNGRLAAAGFYRRHCWIAQGEEFEIVGIPHRVFTKSLADNELRDGEAHGSAEPALALSLTDLADQIRSCPLPDGMTTRVVAIDGCGGAGKTTLAERLATILGMPIVHTDDFASAQDPLDWWPRFVEQVLAPLREQRPPRYQRYDWDREVLADWVVLAEVPSLLIVEGVSASREAFAPYLAFRIWVECDARTRLARGIARDGEAQRPMWERWMREEETYVQREAPHSRADLVILGDPSLPHDPSRQVVCVRSASAIPAP